MTAAFARSQGSRAWGDGGQPSLISAANRRVNPEAPASRMPNQWVGKPPALPKSNLGVCSSPAKGRNGRDVVASRSHSHFTFPIALRFRSSKLGHQHTRAGGFGGVPGCLAASRPKQSWLLCRRWRPLYSAFPRPSAPPSNTSPQNSGCRALAAGCSFGSIGLPVLFSLRPRHQWPLLPRTYRPPLSVAKRENKTGFHNHCFFQGVNLRFSVWQTGTRCRHDGASVTYLKAGSGASVLVLPLRAPIGPGAGNLAKGGNHVTTKPLTENRQQRVQARQTCRLTSPTPVFIDRAWTRKAKNGGGSARRLPAPRTARLRKSSTGRAGPSTAVYHGCGLPDKEIGPIAKPGRAQSPAPIRGGKPTCDCLESATFHTGRPEYSSPSTTSFPDGISTRNFRLAHGKNNLGT